LRDRGSRGAHAAAARPKKALQNFCVVHARFSSAKKKYMLTIWRRRDIASTHSCGTCRANDEGESHGCKEEGREEKGQKEVTQIV
jgi:hypothetical protein